MADFTPFFKKNTIELHFQIFHKNILQNRKIFTTIENGGSYPPQSSSNSGIAHPPNQHFCFGKIFPNFDIKNIISTYTKGFSTKKKMAQICQIPEKKVSKLPDERNMCIKPHSMAIGGK